MIPLIHRLMDMDRSDTKMGVHNQITLLIDKLMDMNGWDTNHRGCALIK